MLLPPWAALCCSFPPFSHSVSIFSIFQSNTSLETLFCFRLHWFAGIICTITPCFSLWNSLKASPGWPPVSFALQRAIHAVFWNPSTCIGEFLPSRDLSPNGQLLKHGIRGNGSYKNSLAGETQTKASPGQATPGIHPAGVPVSPGTACTRRRVSASPLLKDRSRTSMQRRAARQGTDSQLARQAARDS